ncbi:putative serine/threonine-protein kinase [Senna tora]|uniref:Putative serine/threonine-protein kinase n=1 Tax=Senna tora TaxID=362788 RepID=A0A835CB08_9FABA|nr:putative serine/threonine-protein kinase [Senna tora]
MGGICSKSKNKVDEYEKEQDDEKEKELSKSSVQLVAPVITTAEFGGVNDTDGSVNRVLKKYSHANFGSSLDAPLEDKNNQKVVDGKLIKGQHQRCVTLDAGVAGDGKPLMSRVLSMTRNAEGEHFAAGWPSWLSSVAGDAIKGWVPRRLDSFEKLGQVGQGAYSTVHKARDLQTGKVVALKKVRFSNSDPESVRFMAREIYILRQLNHPNVMKLEGIITSRTSSSLYLVFEYMDHDLAGLEAVLGSKFTEPQIKCYMQQLLRGLEHCHSRGVLHRDIKGSNLLIDGNGNLKISDFGLSTIYNPDKKEPMTSRVVTLWYRPPELLLGATEYGAAIDLWSAGCILAEMLVGKPIMPGRTEVEQMHKIFKLCGSPSEEFWQRTKLPHATSFKPQHRYKRRVSETFRDFPPSALALLEKLLAIEPEDRGSATSALQSEFFTTNPLPCDPSTLPKLPPSKEFDVKLRNEEARRKNAEAVPRRETATVARGARDTKVLPTPNFNAQGNISVQANPNTKTCCGKYNPSEDGRSHFKIEPTTVSVHDGYGHSTSVMHPAAEVSVLNHRSDSIRKNPVLRTQRSNVNQKAADFDNSSLNKDKDMSGGDPGTGYVPKKNRMHHSGPLMPPGGNIDDMLREHERLMQEAFRTVKDMNNHTHQNCH